MRISWSWPGPKTWLTPTASNVHTRQIVHSDSSSAKKGAAMCGAASLTAVRSEQNDFPKYHIPLLPTPRFLKQSRQMIRTTVFIHLVTAIAVACGGFVPGLWQRDLEKTKIKKYHYKEQPGTSPGFPSSPPNPPLWQLIFLDMWGLLEVINIFN